MDGIASLSPRELKEFLVHVAPSRPVFIWGQPGAGKSSIVEQFAFEVGMDCVTMMATQLAPEDLIGVPQIVDGRSRFCPPTLIARDNPYVLFLDELNGASHDVQKPFYSLVNERRIGEYTLPKGSIIIGAGNRAQDSALVRPMAAPLLNRMVHVGIRVDFRDWHAWATENNIHPWVLEYLETRPDHLASAAPKHQAPFSTPRSWHMLSDALKAFKDPEASDVEACVSGTITPEHAGQFRGFVKMNRQKFKLASIIKGDDKWPSDPSDLDVLTFLAQAFRAHLIKNLPVESGQGQSGSRELAFRAKALLASLAEINGDIARLVILKDDAGRTLPSWFRAEIARDLPRIVKSARQETESDDE